LAQNPVLSYSPFNKKAKETLNKYGFVVPAKAGTQLIQQAGFPLSRE
jgi:hypothetical protein